MGKLKDSVIAKNVKDAAKEALVEEKVFDIKITKKKMRDTLIKSTISTMISYLVVYLAKLNINIPEELQLELVVGGVLFFNTCIEGVRNWWTHRKMGKEDKK